MDEREAFITLTNALAHIVTAVATKNAEVSQSFLKYAVPNAQEALAILRPSLDASTVMFIDGALSEAELCGHRHAVNALIASLDDDPPLSPAPFWPVAVDVLLADLGIAPAQ